MFAAAPNIESALKSDEASLYMCSLYSVLPAQELGLVCFCFLFDRVPCYKNKVVINAHFSDTFVTCILYIFENITLLEYAISSEVVYYGLGLFIKSDTR